MDVLKVSNLTKKFGDFVAVNDISFQLREGEILGFLGPNGAGKTTTIQMLLSAMTPTTGTIEYFGKNLKNNEEEILGQINFSSTYTNLPWDLTVWENLHFVSYLYDVENRKERIERVIENFNLQSLRNQRVGSLSAGQITRVNLAKAFINYPKILLLDEPTASLDPDVASFIREFLIDVRQKHQVSIILTSHNMKEVEELCDRVIFINHGKIIADDTPYNLARTMEDCELELVSQKDAQKIETFAKKTKHECVRHEYRIKIQMKEHKISEFLMELAHEKLKFEEISVNKPTLEDYFLKQLSERRVHETS